MKRSDMRQPERHDDTAVGEAKNVDISRIRSAAIVGDEARGAHTLRHPRATASHYRAVYAIIQCMYIHMRHV